MARKPGRMSVLSKKVADKTSAELSDEETAILQSTTFDWEKLRPHVNDPLLYDKLREQVDIATENNENLAQLKSRIEMLGKEGFNLALKVVDLAKIVV